MRRRAARTRALRRPKCPSPPRSSARVGAARPPALLASPPPTRTRATREKTRLRARRHAPCACPARGPSRRGRDGHRAVRRTTRAQASTASSTPFVFTMRATKTACGGRAAGSPAWNAERSMPTSVCTGAKPRERSAEAVSAFEVKTRPGMPADERKPGALIVQAPERPRIALGAGRDQVVDVCDAERARARSGAESGAVRGEVAGSDGNVGTGERSGSRAQHGGGTQTPALAPAAPPSGRPARVGQTRRRPGRSGRSGAASGGASTVTSTCERQRAAISSRCRSPPEKPAAQPRKESRKRGLTAFAFPGPSPPRSGPRA